MLIRLVERGARDLQLPRRKPINAADVVEDIANTPPTAIRKRHEPQEIKIYIKLLKKALKYLPLGSRAYYYVSGEIVRANSELRTLGTPASGQSQRDDTGGSSRTRKNEKG